MYNYSRKSNRLMLFLEQCSASFICALSSKNQQSQTTKEMEGKLRGRNRGK